MKDCKLTKINIIKYEFLKDRYFKALTSRNPLNVLFLFYWIQVDLNANEGLQILKKSASLFT